MSAEQNKAKLRLFWDEAINKGNLAVIDDFLAPTETAHWPHQPPVQNTAETLKRGIAQLRAAFPDIELVTEDLFAEGDRVVDLVTVRGTHQGEFVGIPPSGKPIEMQEIHIARIAGGKIVERWTQFDVFGLLQQIGGVPGL